MFATNVRNLKKNPSLALRQAEQAPVLILKGNVPNALLLNFKKTMAETEQAIKPALASSLYKEGVLSLGAAAKLSDLPLTSFVQHLAMLGIEIVQADETTSQEVQDLRQWLKSS
jgi:predicted HTH domain antitoxin